MNEVRDQSNDIAREIQNLEDQIDRLAAQGGGGGFDNGGIPSGTSKTKLLWYILENPREMLILIRNVLFAATSLLNVLGKSGAIYRTKQVLLMNNV